MSLPDGSMAIIAPAECKENPAAYRAMESLRAANDNPISEIYYRDLRESMKNGGGPACLRLRVVMDEAGWGAVLPSVKYNDALHNELEAVIQREYPEDVTFTNLRDVAFFGQIEKTTVHLQNLLLHR